MLALTVTASRSSGLDEPLVTCRVSATAGPLSSPGPWPLTVTVRDPSRTARAPPPTATVRDGAAGARVARDFDGTGVSGSGEDVGAGGEGDAVPDAVGPAAEGPAADEAVVAGDELAACPDPPE